MHRLSLSFSIVILAILIFMAAWPLATASTATAAGLGVTGSLLDVTMPPGTTYVHTMTVSNGFDYALDMQVEACGLGQELDGSYVPLTSSKDETPYSAIDYIADIDHTAFHIEPHATQVVNATIDCPSDATPGTRYASIYIHSTASNEGPVGVSVGAIIPVVVGVTGATQVKTGEITGLTVGELKSREPINISTIFNNTGTYHYKVTNQVTINDGAGDVFSNASTELTISSIIPIFSRLFSVSCIPSNEDNGLPSGEYLVVSKVILEDGTVLDVETTGLTIPEWYKPPSEKEPGGIGWVPVAIGILAGLVVLTFVTYLFISQVRK